MQKIIANIKFIIGPAAETIASPFDIDIVLLKFVGLICTGFPHPTLANSNINEPIGSKCAKGFKLSLPCNLGVSSPNLSAAKACANSWNVIAIKTPGILYNSYSNAFVFDSKPIIEYPATIAKII